MLQPSERERTTTRPQQTGSTKEGARAANNVDLGATIFTKTPQLKVRAGMTKSFKLTVRPV